MNPVTDHIPAEQLVDLVDGQLTSVTAAQVREHLAGCIPCTAELNRLERTVLLLRNEGLEDAPPEVQARAVRLLSARRAPAAPSLRQRLLATLRFDSAVRPLALGARSAQPGSRHLLFLAAEHQLDVRIAWSDALWTMTGQLLGPDESGEVALHGPAASWRATLNELGEFTLPPVPSGSYLLSVHLADLDIDVPDVSVGIAE